MLKKNDVDVLRDSRKGAPSIFILFIDLKDKHHSKLFCCFEGDDYKYYGFRIENLLQINSDNLQFFTCGGKREVLRLYEMINQNEKYKDVKISYFVDKDFDESIIEKYNKKIYETPCYSIENFYTTVSAFKKILKYEFNIDEPNEDFQICLDLFNARQKEFHDKIKLFNAWIYCQRDLSNSNGTSRLDLTDFKLNKIIPEINLNEIVARYDKEKIEELFPKALKIPNESLELKIAELERLNPQICFRGKFEIDFLYKFIQAMKLEFKKPDGLIKKQRGVKMTDSRQNLISELSQYADTPICLKNYICSFK